MSFSGFSEDDIRKLTKGHDVAKQKGSNKTIIKKGTLKPSNTVNTSSRSKSVFNNNITSRNSVQEIPETARLSKCDNSNNATNKEVNTPKQPIIEEKPNITDKPTEVIDNHCENGKGKKFKDLDEFEARQKLIEEQNRKRKELLAKALADRTKQTQEEAQRLNEIQEEFKKLDAMLSCDVKILRKQIESASVEYMECQKKYNKIEKEFLEAKLVLHQKQEKKEMLTEHLCTIIEKNEERKADKLNELLEKLQLSPAEVIVNKNDTEAKQGDYEENSK